MQKTFTVLGVVALTAVLVGHEAAAGSAPVALAAKPQPAPTPAPQLNAAIVSMKRKTAGLDDRYKHGPIAYAVEIKNPSSTELSTQLLVKRVAPIGTTATFAPIAVHVAPGATGIVMLTDPPGLSDDESCTVLRYRLDLASQLTVLPTTYAKATPDCTWTITDDLAWTHMVPDRVADARNGHVYYGNPKHDPAPLTCGGILSVKADVSNHGTLAAKGVRLFLRGPVGAPMTSDPFELAPGAMHAADVGIPFSGRPGAYSLSVEDISGPPVAQPGYTATVARACAMPVTLGKTETF